MGSSRFGAAWVLVLCVGLAACGQSESEGESQADAGAQAEATGETATEAAAPPEAAAASVSGTLVASGKTVELPFVYVYALEEGFYNPSDPAWKLLFVEKEIPEHKVDETVWDSAYVELAVTKTAEEGGAPELQVYSQSIRFGADSAGNVSGGTYPTLELTASGPDRFAGRVYHAEQQEFFDDTYQYDFTFSAPLSDPNAPIGDPLPADGGEPGQAYLAWVAAIHSGDIEQVKKLVPAEVASEMEGPEVQEELEMMKALTPTDIKIKSGSSDGTTAMLQVEGVMEGQAVAGEITLEKMDGRWVATNAAW